MPKAASASNKKAQTTTKKEKRPPSAYNLFVKANLQPWRTANPGKTMGEAMSHISVLWRDHPDNPNRGKEPKARKPKKDQNKENLGSDQTIPSSDD